MSNSVPTDRDFEAGQKPAENISADVASPPGGSSTDGEGSDTMTAVAVSPSRRRPEKLFRISEVAEYMRTTRQTIHNYTAMGLLKESRWSSGGHRLYDETVFERLDVIAALRARRKSLEDIREHLARLEGA